MNSTELKAKIAKTDSLSTKVRYILTRNEKLCWCVALTLYGIIVFWGWSDITNLPKEERADSAGAMAAFTCFGWGMFGIIVMLIGEFVNVIAQILIGMRRNKIVSKLSKVERFECFINDCRKARK
ncbi:hypothetical protein VPA32_orf138 [Klebsiella phage vB_KpnM_VPA32]|nr:hypothetical protein VPA32_orf138 [Klebsiella phage vB_KpnM_VPA32]